MILASRHWLASRLPRDIQVKSQSQVHRGHKQISDTFPPNSDFIWDDIDTLCFIALSPLSLSPLSLFLSSLSLSLLPLSLSLLSLSHLGQKGVFVLYFVLLRLTAFYFVLLRFTSFYFGLLHSVLLHSIHRGFHIL